MGDGWTCISVPSSSLSGDTSLVGVLALIRAASNPPQKTVGMLAIWVYIVMPHYRP
jgi:hypothetical protein